MQSYCASDPGGLQLLPCPGEMAEVPTSPMSIVWRQVLRSNMSAWYWCRFESIETRIRVKKTAGWRQSWSGIPERSYGFVAHARILSVWSRTDAREMKRGLWSCCELDVSLHPFGWYSLY